MSTIDTEHRRLCHALFDAIEAGDIDAVAQCYAPDMTLWFNVTGQVMSREDNLAALVTGRDLHRRRTYNDRIVNTLADGFVAQYTVNVERCGSRIAGSEPSKAGSCSSTRSS